MTLYPTWFRWNFWNSPAGFLYSLLYIPHGSDETQPLDFIGFLKKIIFNNILSCIDSKINSYKINMICIERLIMFFWFTQKKL